MVLSAIYCINGTDILISNQVRLASSDSRRNAKYSDRHRRAEPIPRATPQPSRFPIRRQVPIRLSPASYLGVDFFARSHPTAVSESTDWSMPKTSSTRWTIARLNTQKRPTRSLFLGRADIHNRRCRRHLSRGWPQSLANAGPLVFQVGLMMHNNN